MNKEKVSVALSKDLLEWINKQAELEGRSRSNFIEYVLRKYREGRFEIREKRVLREEPTGAVVR